MHDDLFRPTISEQPPPGKPPWRPESIVYPAFFGGPLAAATLGLLNGRRLALPTTHLVAIGAAGVAGFGARIAVGALTDGNSALRLAGTVCGLLVWLVVLSLQRRPFRVATLRGREPARLIGPGFAAAIGCGLFEALVLAVLVR
ncbi:hypothetical protein M1L60_06195 [Actinoplanes sp. TRM 88003]|uniref:DUF4345 domain-containing protein n=1 Tax=Paractinoplanes aksuensis TaxID=2939490 RepID=A0ABT1DH82_9ACTN|nr:hypothetical protein [Actinoplanes aksuensis]MCO8270182.1 hypothetical protein [Actinoplanes aksuensis]